MQKYFLKTNLPPLSTSFGRRIEYNNERRVAKIQSATRRRLEGKGRSKISAATPVHSRPGSAASNPNAKDDEVEENVGFAPNKFITTE